MKKKVLILDDMEMNRHLIKSFLTIKGFEVEVAEDGMEGMNHLKDKSFDLIFSDIEMPNMNGFEFLRRVKTNPKHKNTPVVMLTTLDKQEHKDRAKKLGASHYLVKPFTREKITEVLTDLKMI